MLMKFAVLLGLAAACTAQSAGEMRLWNVALGERGGGDLLSTTEENVVCPARYEKSQFSIRCYYPPGDNARRGRAGMVKFYVNRRRVQKEGTAPYFLAGNSGWTVRPFDYRRALKGRKRFRVTCKVPGGRTTTVRIRLRCQMPKKADCLRFTPRDLAGRMPAGWKKMRRGLLFAPKRGRGAKKTVTPLLLERYSPSTTRYACALDLTTWGGKGAIMMRSADGLILRAENTKNVLVGGRSWSTLARRAKRRGNKARRALQPFVQMDGKPYSLGTRASRAGLKVGFEFMGMDKVLLHAVVCFPCEEWDCISSNPLWKLGAKQCRS